MSVKPLKGVRVIEMTNGRAEICGRFLADLGADVILVEPPEGSAARRAEAVHGGTSLNAGSDPEAARFMNDSEDWTNVMKVHLDGLFFAMKYEIPAILEQGGGSIVNMSSIFGTGAHGSAPPSYVAAKRGAVGASRAAATQYAKKGIRVNVDCPAYIRTPMFERAYAENQELVGRVREMHPMGRLGEPEEVAEAVRWLLSDAASFITGHTLMIDGGMSAKV